MGSDGNDMGARGSQEPLFKNVALPNLKTSGEDAPLLEALKRSGYLLELRVSRILEHRGFTVLLNRVLSNGTGAIETDIIAYKDVVLDPAWRLKGARPNKEVPAVLRQLLLCECVNNPKPLAFFARVQQALDEAPFIWSSHDSVITKSGSVKSIRLPTFDLLRSTPGVRLEQRFCATQYCAFDVKEQQRTGQQQPLERWIATQSPQTYQSIESLCSVLLSARTEWEREEGLFYYARPILLTSRSNVLVQQDPTSALCIDEAGALTLVWSPRSDALGGKQVRMDVVAESGLPEFLAFTERIGGFVAEALRFHLPSWPEWGT